jgi:hypothetical protein
MLTVPQLLAAGLAVAVLSAGGVWAALGGAGVPSGPAGALGPAGSSAAQPRVVLAAYEPAMSDLEEEYQRRRDELDPETVQVVERNLAIIDVAIREASAALAADLGTTPRRVDVRLVQGELVRQGADLRGTALRA